MIVLTLISNKNPQLCYSRSLKSFDMKLFEKMKNSLKNIKTENELEKNFLRFVSNYMLNPDERQRLSPKKALSLLSKLIKKFSGDDDERRAISLIENTKRGGLDSILEKKEIKDPAESRDVKSLEAGREETVRDVLLKQTEMLKEEENEVLKKSFEKEKEEIPKSSVKNLKCSTPKNTEKKKLRTDKKKRKKKKKKKNKKQYLQRMSLLNLKKIQKKISKNL